MLTKNNWNPWDYIFKTISQSFPGEKVKNKTSLQLLSKRMVVLQGEITKRAAERVITKVLELEAQDKFHDILFCLNSNGGDVKAGMAIYEVMQFTACDVVTFCIGQAASMAVLLLAAGAPGKRMALPGTRIMFHQPWSGPGDSTVDEEHQIKHMILLKELLNNIISQHTDGFFKNAFPAELCGKFFLTAREAKTYHLIDHIVSLSDSMN